MVHVKTFYTDVSYVLHGFLHPLTYYPFLPPLSEHLPRIERVRMQICLGQGLSSVITKGPNLISRQGQKVRTTSEIIFF